MQTRIICLEGIIGAGKTTQASKISEELSIQGKKHIVINEKQYEPFKQMVIDWHNLGANQNFSYENILRFAKARAETHKRHFEPLIGKLDYLVFDRSLYTAGVYQSNENFSVDDIIEINLNEGVIKPEEGIILICSAKIAFSRAEERRKKESNYSLPSTKETIEDITKRRELYIQLSTAHPELYLISSEKGIEEIFTEIKKLLNL